MQFCFIANGDVLTLPITPASYEWTTGIFYVEGFDSRIYGTVS